MECSFNNLGEDGLVKTRVRDVAFGRSRPWSCSVRLQLQNFTGRYLEGQV